MQSDAHHLHDHTVILLHAALDPVEHDPDEAVFIKPGNKRLILLRQLYPGAPFLHHIRNQLKSQLVQIVLDLIPADRAIDVHNKSFILHDRLEDLVDPLLPCIVGLFILQRFPAVLDAAPLHQIIDVFKMIIECHAADSAVCRKIIDRYFIKWSAQEQFLKRCLQSVFGRTGHECFYLSIHDSPGALRHSFPVN